MQHVICLRSHGVFPQIGIPASLYIAWPASAGTPLPLPLPEELAPEEEGLPDDEVEVLLLLDPVLLLLLDPVLLLLLPLVPPLLEVLLPLDVADPSSLLKF
jgi:hypothetical protein